MAPSPSARTTDTAHDGPIFPFHRKEPRRARTGPALGWLTSPTSPWRRASLTLRRCSMPGRGGCGYALARSIDARLTLAALERVIALRHPAGMRLPFRSRGAVRLRKASKSTGEPRRPRARRLDEPARQFLRQGHGRELLEDAQGRANLLRRLRRLRGRRPISPQFHLGDLQRHPPALSSGLRGPKAVRASIRLKPRRNRHLERSSERALSK